MKKTIIKKEGKFELIKWADENYSVYFNGKLIAKIKGNRTHAEIKFSRILLKNKKD